MTEPLFPSYDELNERMYIAKRLRSEFVRGLAIAAKQKFAPQSRFLRITASGLVFAVAAGTLWATLVASPKVTEAGPSNSNAAGVEVAGR